MTFAYSIDLRILHFCVEYYGRMATVIFENPFILFQFRMFLVLWVFVLGNAFTQTHIFCCMYTWTYVYSWEKSNYFKFSPSLTLSLQNSNSNRVEMHKCIRLTVNKLNTKLHLDLLILLISLWISFFSNFCLFSMKIGENEMENEFLNKSAALARPRSFRKAVSLSSIKYT